METTDKIFTVLDELGISYKKLEHPAFFTCADSAAYYPDLKGGRSKNLFLRNRKGDQHYLVTLESHKRLDLKALQEMLNESKLSFASERRLLEHLGLTPGAVSPLALVNDKDHQVKAIVDQSLFDFDELYYHPGINTATLVMSPEDFKKFLASTGNKVSFVNFDTLTK